MNCKLFNVISFVAGATIGSMVTWKLVKSKYEQLAQEEIDSVKETYAKRNGVVENVELHIDTDKPDISEYTAKLRELGYLDNGETESDEVVDEQEDEEYEEEEEEDVSDEPYVISPDEFDEVGYETESLTYYADGILTDEFDEVIEDVDDVVGLDSLNHFGEYEDDSVFVRNDSRERDYEILKDFRKYSDVHPQYKE